MILKNIDYAQINYECGSHKQHYISYCDKCRKNLCLLCDTKHEKIYKDHETKSYKNIMPDADDNKINLNQLKDKINRIKNNIDEAIKMFNEVKKHIDAFYEIYEKILNNYNEENRNYQIIQNINSIKTFNAINDINQIYNDNNFSNKLVSILNIYNKIKAKTEITIKYKIDENEENIKIFDSDFIKNNEQFCKIIYKNKEYDLTEYFDIPKKREKCENALKITFL